MTPLAQQMLELLSVATLLYIAYEQPALSAAEKTLQAAALQEIERRAL